MKPDRDPGPAGGIGECGFTEVQPETWYPSANAADHYAGCPEKGNKIPSGHLTERYLAPMVKPVAGAVFGEAGREEVEEVHDED